MDDDLAGRRAGNAGGNRPTSARACGRCARGVPARKGRDHYTAPQNFVRLLPSINGDWQLVEHGCCIPDRGRLLAFAA
jgi:hypothetical protein